MSKVAIVGSGFVGRAWAISFARAGHEVALWDGDPAAPAKALAFIDAVLPDLVANDLVGGASAADLRARMTPVADLGEALEGATHVQENTAEDVGVKREIFARPRRAGLARRGAGEFHIGDPAVRLHARPCAAARAAWSCIRSIRPISIPAVEVVPAPWTDPDIVERAAAFLRAAGHAPIVMKREIDGFVMNRMQGALLEEAFRLVADGYASDRGRRHRHSRGLGVALVASWGRSRPSTSTRPGGVRDYAERYQKIYEGIFPSMQRRVDWSGPVMENDRGGAPQATAGRQARRTAGLARPPADGAGSRTSGAPTKTSDAKTSENEHGVERKSSSPAPSPAPSTRPRCRRICR